jgi:hypothetical protein
VIKQLKQLAKHNKLASFTEDTSFFVFGGTQRRFGDLTDRIAESIGAAKVSYIVISMPMIMATPASVFERMRRAGIAMFYHVASLQTSTYAPVAHVPSEQSRVNRRALGVALLSVGTESVPGMPKRMLWRAGSSTR